LLAGKPLIAYAIESSIKSKIFSHVVVSTEDKEIARISQKFGAEVPFLRPKKLATDSTGMTEVVLHGLKKLHALGYDFDTFVNRDCTVPFLRNKDVAGSIRLLKRKNCNAVFGVYRQHLNPYFNIMELDSNVVYKLQTQHYNSFVSISEYFLLHLYFEEKEQCNHDLQTYQNHIPTHVISLTHEGLPLSYL
jgi:N-acylneuraminate cytidylyltransferase/CMP-N,N'-diacetyllegionaminic acid synthase